MAKNRDVAEIWKEYLPVVWYSKLGDTIENPVLFKKIDDLIIPIDNSYLLNIKRMAVECPFNFFFPLSNESAHEHIHRLEEEHNRGNPVKIPSYILIEEEKKLKLKYSEYKTKGFSVYTKLKPENIDFTDKFLNKINLFFNIDSNNFIADFSDKLQGSYNISSIFKSFENYFAREIAFNYIPPDDLSDKHVIKTINSIKGENRFVPNFLYTMNLIINKYNFPRGEGHLKLLQSDNTEKEIGWNDWTDIRNQFMIFLLLLDDDKKLKNIEKVINDDLGKFIKYINELINDSSFVSEVEKKRKENIDIELFIVKTCKRYKSHCSLDNDTSTFTNYIKSFISGKGDSLRKYLIRKINNNNFEGLKETIEEKTNEYNQKFIMSLNKKVKSKEKFSDGVTELIDLQKDTRNYNTFFKELLSKEMLPEIKLSLSDVEIDNLRNKWLVYFKEAFDGNDYSKKGIFNFSDIKIFRRFINWLLPYILFNDLQEYEEILSEKIEKKTNRNDLSDTEQENLSKDLTMMSKVKPIVEHLNEQLQNYDLFIDFCRVHELFGCSTILCNAKMDSNNEIQCATSIRDCHYDINKCNICKVNKNVNNIKKSFSKEYKYFINNISIFINNISNDIKKENEKIMEEKDG